MLDGLVDTRGPLSAWAGFAEEVNDEKVDRKHDEVADDADEDLRTSERHKDNEQRSDWKIMSR